MCLCHSSSCPVILYVYYCQNIREAWREKNVGNDFESASLNKMQVHQVKVHGLHKKELFSGHEMCILATQLHKMDLLSSHETYASFCYTQRNCFLPMRHMLAPLLHRKDLFSSHKTYASPYGQ